MKSPNLEQAGFIAPGAAIWGDVTVGENSSVWFGAVIRSESSPIIIGKNSNIQDNAVVHENAQFPVVIGDQVTVGHGAILHGCRIGDNTLVGMGAIVMNGAKIGKNCIIGAGALVTQNMIIEDGSLVFGSPAQVKRQVTAQEAEKNTGNALAYVEKAKTYREALSGKDK